MQIYFGNMIEAKAETYISDWYRLEEDDRMEKINDLLHIYASILNEILEECKANGDFGAHFDEEQAEICYDVPNEAYIFQWGEARLDEYLKETYED